MKEIISDSCLVSVIIPTHKRHLFLKLAIDSVLSQTYQNFEIIVISDGYDQLTNDVMKEYCKFDKRIKYHYYNQNRGANYARNYGVSMAKSEFIAFLDDDDRWLPCKLEKQLNIFSKDKEIGLVATGIISKLLKGKKTKIFIPSAIRDSSKKILLHNCIGSTTTVMLNKKIFNECGMFDESLEAMQDYDLWIRVCQITKIGIVKEPCVEYTISHAQNQISSNTKKYINSSKIINEKYSFLINNLTEKEKSLKYYNENIHISKKGIKNGNFKIARKYAKNAFKYKKKLIPIILYLISFFPYKIILKYFR